MPALVNKVLEGSIAEELEIEAGDEILSIDGSEMSDMIDYNFLCKSDLITIEIKKKATGDIEEIEIEKENLNNAYINDTVRVQLKSNNTGVVLNVLKHDLWHLVVEYQNKKFVYDDKFFPYKLQILNNKKFHLVNGHIILLKVKKYNKNQKRPHPSVLWFFIIFIFRIR